MELTNVQIERGEGGLVTLQIEVGPEAVKVARDRVIKDLSRRLRVPGFRPGHIPAAIVRRQVGDESIAQSVSDQIVPEAYQAALQQSNLQPLDRAQVDELDFEAFDGQKALQFTARVIVRPEMELIEYSNLTATQPRVEVSDEDVERGLEELRRQRATLRDIEDRGAQSGDILNAELRVFIDGEERGDEPGKLRGFVIGEGGFVPSIDEPMMGAKLDEERRFEVTYPDDFKDEELAGKKAEFAVKITALKESVQPELTDEFAATLGMDDMAAVRGRMREAIQEGRERESQEFVRADILRQLVEGTPFEVPPTLLDERTQRRVSNVEGELAQRGGTLENYLTAIGKTREEFEADVRGEVESEMKQELVLDEVAQREELVASQDELEAHYYQVAQAMQQPIEKVVERLDVEQARASILQRKALEMLLEQANVVEGDPLPIDGGEDEEIDASSTQSPPDAIDKAATTSEEVNAESPVAPSEATASEATAPEVAAPEAVVEKASKKSAAKTVEAGDKTSEA